MIERGFVVISEGAGRAPVQAKHEVVGQVCSGGERRRAVVLLQSPDRVSAMYCSRWKKGNVCLGGSGNANVERTVVSWEADSSLGHTCFG